MVLVVGRGVQRIDISLMDSGRGTDTLSLFRNSGEVAELQCNATTRFRPQRRHLIFLRVHLLDINISYSGTMTDRAAKRLRRLSTEYDDSEENTEWNNSRYVADIPSRLVAPSFLAPRARGEAARHKAATVDSSKQSAAEGPATGQCHDGSPPLCATRAVNPCARKQKERAS